MPCLVQLLNCLMCNFLTNGNGKTTSVSFVVTLGIVPVLKFPGHKEWSTEMVFYEIVLCEKCIPASPPPPLCLMHWQQERAIVCYTSQILPKLLRGSFLEGISKSGWPHWRHFSQQVVCEVMEMHSLLCDTQSSAAPSKSEFVSQITFALQDS